MANRYEIDYKQQLQAEKDSLTEGFIHANKLLAEELDRVLTGGGKGKYTEIHHDKPIRLYEKILLPVAEYPKVNFVGRLIGPGGANMKALQDLTGCKFSVLGRGTMKDKKKEDDLRAQGGKHSHLNDEQHVLIEVFAAPGEGHLRLGHAINEVKKYLAPDFDDTTYMQNGEAAATATATPPALLQPNPASFAPPPGPRGMGPAPGVPAGRARPGMPPPAPRPGMPPAMAPPRPGMPPAVARPGMPPVAARPGAPPAMARPGAPPARPPMAMNQNPAARGMRPAMMPPSHTANTAAPPSMYGAPPQAAYAVQQQTAFVEQDPYAMGDAAADYALADQSQMQDPYLGYDQSFDPYGSMASEVQMQSVADQQYGGYATDYTNAVDQWGVGTQDSSYGKVLPAARTAMTTRQQPYATSAVSMSAAGRMGAATTATSGGMGRGGMVGGAGRGANAKAVARRF